VNSPISYSIKDIMVTDSTANFLEIVNLVDNSAGTHPVQIEFSNATLTDFTLSSQCNLSLSNSTAAFIHLDSFNYALFDLKFVDSKFKRINQELCLFHSECNGNVTIELSEISSINECVALVFPAAVSSSVPQNFHIVSSDLVDNYGGIDGNIRATTNAHVRARNSTFRNNYSMGRGSVFYADLTASHITVEDSTFEKNYALKGGVAFTHSKSLIEISNSSFTHNFAVQGGSIYVNDEGYAHFENTTFEENMAFGGTVGYFINSQDQSKFSDTIFKNNLQRPGSAAQLEAWNPAMAAEFMAVLAAEDYYG